MKFRVLGPLEVEVDRRTIVLGRAKERRLLAMLLLHANETVSTERLVDALWGEQPPPTAAKLVQTYVSHLRKVVPGVIETRPSGYVARVGDGDLDLARFTELADRAR